MGLTIRWRYIFPLLILSLMTTGCASRLERAISDGDLAAAQSALENGAALDAKWYYSPLHGAIENSDIAMLRLLHANGAPLNVCYLDTEHPEYWDLSKSDYFRDTMPPLGSAIARNDATIIDELINLGAPLDQQCQGPFGSSYRFSAILAAAEFGAARLVETLIARGVSPNRLENGLTPLSIAAHNGHVEVARVLLANGAFHTYSNQIRQPIEYALDSGHEDIVNLLVSSGAVRPSRKDYSKTLDTIADTLVDGVILVGTIALIAQGVKYSGYASDGPNYGGYGTCRVYISSTRSNADYFVYLSSTKSNQRNHQLLRNCRLSSSRANATMKVYITSTRSNANIIIDRSDFPKR